ncbi:helix-hairpin-helix domain-containing protein [Bacillus massiliigorillae]|uniref:helix-hairpin-helix domain-containing protein n=1 Tax=Bacillus massiliigorillae TaxID=1243664 RepID=UPI001E370338|nr:helix-hairpin-helix domain-containing protein [Bacillus massiliigorillae]
MAQKKIWLIVGGAVGILILLVMMYFFTNREEDVLTAENLLEQAPAKEAVTKEANVQEEVIKKVDVKGAVNRPGVYMAGKDDRVLDIIEKAGSFTAKADRNAVNLAQRVEDQMLIYVPNIGEQPPQTNASIAVGGNPSTSQGGGKVNINSASEEDLQTISGIGPAKAKAIIQYRTEKGSFSSIDELKEISGIGDKTFEKLKDQVTI